MKRRGILIILTSPSGAGKTSILEGILKKDNSIEYSVSVTTRPMRKGEINHVHYHFVSVEEFKKLIEQGVFYEWAIVHNNYYGTRRDVVENKVENGIDVLFDIDVQGALNVKRQSKDAVLIFIIAPSLKILEERLRNRGTDSEEVIQSRLMNARKEMEKMPEFDYIVVNDKLEETIENVWSIIIAERHKRARLDLDELKK